MTVLLPNCIFQFFNNGSGNYQKGEDYQRFKGILWYIIAGTKGGSNRARILDLLGTKSLNAHQISKELNLDHKTVAHHLEILSKNAKTHEKDKTKLFATLFVNFSRINKSHLPHKEGFVKIIDDLSVDHIRILAFTYERTIKPIETNEKMP